MIIRDEHRQCFTQVANVTIMDSSLSLQAKGLMVMLLSKPDAWNFSLSKLSRETRSGIRAVRSAMKELIDAGYVQDRGTTHGADGHITGREYAIFETRRAN